MSFFHDPYIINEGCMVAEVCLEADKRLACQVPSGVQIFALYVGNEYEKGLLNDRTQDTLKEMCNTHQRHPRSLKISF